MGRKCDLTPRKKQVIRTLLNENVKYRDVLAKCKKDYGFDVSLGSIAKLARSPSIVSAASRAGKCGRRRKLTKRDIRHLRALAKQNRRLPSRKLAILFQNVVGKEISRNIVLRELARSGMTRMKPKYKPLLSAKNKADRLSFANAHLAWHHEWESVVFSDEKKFNVFANDNGLRLWIDDCEIYGSQIAHRCNYQNLVSPD